MVFSWVFGMPNTELDSKTLNIAENAASRRRDLPQVAENRQTTVRILTFSGSQEVLRTLE